MKKWFLYTAVFFTSYIVFMVASLPITTVLPYVNLPQNVQIIGASGTIWDANVKQLNIRKNNNKSISINKINVKPKISSLLTFDPAITLYFGSPSLAGPVGHLTLNHLLGNDLNITNAQISLPAQDISEQITLPIAVDAFGQVSLKLTTYSLGKPLCNQVNGVVTWPKAALSAFEQTAELGNLSAKLSCEKGVLVATIDPNNKLGLSFNAYIRNSNNISGNGYLKPSAEFPQSLRQALPFLGKQDRQGRYRLGF